MISAYLIDEATVELSSIPGPELLFVFFSQDSPVIVTLFEAVPSITNSPSSSVRIYESLDMLIVAPSLITSLPSIVNLASSLVKVSTAFFSRVTVYPSLIFAPVPPIV